MTRNLNNVLEEIGNSVNQEIHKLGYEPRPIRVPLGIKLNDTVTNSGKCYRVSKFYSFTNGLVEVRDGEWRYLHTDYASSNNELYDSAVEAAKKRIETEIFNATGKKPNFIPVKIDDANDSGLRCIVKVIARGQ